MMNMFEKSLLVAAHPDDEILWFSSILEKMDRVIICFTDCRDYPQWGEGRRRSIAEYPLRQISSLELTESGAFDCADWEKPGPSRYGLQIKNKAAQRRYMRNFHQLKELLAARLIDVRNVFTHNPWGEYGHEEHVQLYRVLKELSSELSFNLWFNNYSSDRALPLMSRTLFAVDLKGVMLATNRTLALDIKGLYMRNKCWTWHHDWEWPVTEALIRDQPTDGGNFQHLPIHLIRVSAAVPKKRQHSLIGAGLRKVGRLWK